MASLLGEVGNGCSVLQRERSEKGKAGTARGARAVDSARSGVDPGTALTERARLLRSLQSTAGNRSAAALVKRWRDESGAAGLSQAPRPVVQRKLRVEGDLYGKDDAAELQDLKLERGLPNWTQQQLEGDDTYVVNREMTAWVKETDTSLYFYRHKYLPGKEPVGQQGTKGYDKKLSLNDADPLAAIGFGAGDKTRVGPKHPDRRTVSKISLFNYETTLPDGHWMLQCEVDQGEGGKTGKKQMKIDLVAAGYRIYYGVTPQTPVKNEKVTQGEVHFQLQSARTVRDVYGAFLAVAKEKRNWTGTRDYNCQDFALAMLKKLGVANEEQQRLVKAGEFREGTRRENVGDWSAVG